MTPHATLANANRIDDLDAPVADRANGLLGQLLVVEARDNTGEDQHSLAILDTEVAQLENGTVGQRHLCPGSNVGREIAVIGSPNTFLGADTVDAGCETAARASRGETRSAGKTEVSLTVTREDHSLPSNVRAATSRRSLAVFQTEVCPGPPNPAQGVATVHPNNECSVRTTEKSIPFEQKFGDSEGLFRSPRPRPACGNRGPGMRGLGQPLSRSPRDSIGPSASTL